MKVPTLLQPILLSSKNRWTHPNLRKKALKKDISIFILSSIIICFLYFGMHTILLSVKSTGSLITIHPSIILQLFMMVFFWILVLSSAVSCISTLYTSQDVELILKSPLTNGQIYWNFFFKIFHASGWMLVVFGLPIITAFGTAYNANFSYYLVSLLGFALLVSIPIALSIGVMLFLCSFFSAKTIKHILLLTASLSLFLIYFFLNQTSLSSSKLTQAQSILNLFSKFSTLNKDWLPSLWLANMLGELLEPIKHNAYDFLILILSGTAACVCLSQLIFQRFYRISIGKAQNHRSGLQISSKGSQKLLILLTGFLPSDFRALLSKELKLFSRDITQTIQLLLLIGICVGYLYNFKLLSPQGDSNDPVELWKAAILMIFNLSMGSFVIIAICTRFVFPSVSLEGKMIWLLQTGPISIKRFLIIKSILWFIPIAIISSVIFISGALTINVAPILIVYHEIICLLLCFGLTGTAIGLGAFFHQFDWENQAQLSTSLGSLAFMVAASLLVISSVVPSSLLLIFRTLRISSESDISTSWYFLILIAIILIAYINFLAFRWSIKAGAASLQRLGHE